MQRGGVYMDKYKEIRPVALGIAVKNGKILVTEGTDKLSGKFFYRCLGGGIEFLEKGADALKREFKEEIKIDVDVKELLGISENIFTFEGKRGHELILLFRVEINDSDYKEEYYVENDSGPDTRAVWIDVDEFKSQKSIIYPEEILTYL